MTYVADESVAAPIIARLRADGATVLSIRETTPGISDDEVLARASAVPAILLTEDKDFGESVWQHGACHHGIVLIRLSALPPTRAAIDFLASRRAVIVPSLRFASGCDGAHSLRVGLG